MGTILVDMSRREVITYRLEVPDDLDIDDTSAVYSYMCSEIAEDWTAYETCNEIVGEEIIGVEDDS